MIPNINPNDLVIFYIVAREKNLSSAAEKVFLTQPAITYHIQSLEKYTKVKLLEFRKRQVILTPHGRELFKYAEEIFRQLAGADLFVQSLKYSNLRVGIASVYDTCISPLLSSMFEAQNPEIKLTIKSGNAFEMVQNVLDSALDLAIVPRSTTVAINLIFPRSRIPKKSFASPHPARRCPKIPSVGKTFTTIPS
jgi:DNA-binding transcriptional LysR family regulator